MQHEVMEMLSLGQDGIYLDATIGLGGHAEEILKLIGSEARLIGIDRDEDALKLTEKRLSDKRVILKRGDGELIATIADTGKRTTKIPPHVHISVAWLPKSVPYERLDWKTMSDRSVVTLCDPLEFIECKYKVERYGRDIIKA